MAARRARYLCWVVVGLLLSCLAGCTAYVARQIERPGHDARMLWVHADKMLRRAHFKRRYLDVSPRLRLTYWHAWPYDYGAYVVEHGRYRKHGFTLHWKMRFRRPLDEAHPLPPRGSVVLLHPWGERSEAMATWGLLFASAGYAVVMPDLRSQGDSTDAPVGYGPREAGDIVELVKTLRAQRRLPSPVYLLGHSYGATVALFAAPRLPSVRGVVALAPYANAAAVLRRAPSSGLFDGSGLPWWLHWLAHWLTPARMDRAIDRASHKLGVDLSKVDADAVMATAHACEIIVHGSRDRLTSSRALRRLGRQSPRAAFVNVPGVGHVDLLMRTDWLFGPIVQWMQTLLAPEADTCPALQLPATDPLMPLPLRKAEE